MPKKSTKTAAKASAKKLTAKQRALAAINDAYQEAIPPTTPPDVEAIAPETKPAKVKAPNAEKKMSALAAAAKVLADAGLPLNAKEIVERMATAGLWTSPAGKTPHATIYAAMLRSVMQKGEASPFRKAERGKFTVVS